MKVSVPPTPVCVEGQWQLGYEVHLANRSGKLLALDDFSVLDGHDGHTIARLSGKQLDRDAAIVGTASAPGSSNLAPIKPGQQVVLFIDISMPPRATIDSIRQRLSYHVAGTARASHIASAPLALHEVRPSLIAPPLRGGPWVAIHSPVWPRGHRRVFYSVAGHQRLPGRFAIDWVKVDSKGRFTDGDADMARAWYGYGADVLAVANASVAAVRDGMDEPARISQRTPHVPAEDAGNYVTLRLPDGRFAFYEHLKKGSIRVAVGSKVDVGQVIGSLGFSGESTGPHLHFHVADANSPLGAEGMPFEIRRFTRLGRYDDISKLGKPWNPADGDAARQDEWPHTDTVVTFRDGSATASSPTENTGR